MRRHKLICPLLACLTAATIAAGATRTLSGKVLDSEGKPVAKAQVTCYVLRHDGAPDRMSTEVTEKQVTGKDGVYEFHLDLESGAGNQFTVLVADKPGHALGWSNWAGGPDGEVDITMGTVATVSGRVLDQAKRPLAGVDVGIAFMIVNDPAPRYLMGQVNHERLRTTTDAGGRFLFACVPEQATLEFLLRADGYGTLCTFSPDSYGGNSLRYKAKQTDISLVLEPEARVSGRVVKSGTDEGVPGVPLSITADHTRMESSWITPVSSGDGGRFALTRLRSGSYKLGIASREAEDAGWVCKPIDVAVKAGQRVDDFTLEVSPGGILEVLVKSAETGKPLPGAVVGLADASKAVNRQRPTGEDGVVRLRLPAASYGVRSVYKQNYVFEKTPAATTAVVEGKTVRIEVALKGQPKIAGTVVDSEGKPVKDARVSLMPQHFGQPAQTDEDGHFETRYNPRMYGDEEPEMFVLVRHEKRRLATLVPFDQETSTLDLRLEPGLVLEGDVVDPDGKPLREAKVTVYLQAGRYGSSIDGKPVKTDRQGHYTIEGLPKGQRYSVCATADGYGQRSVTLEPAQASADGAELAPIALDVADMSISGVVVDEDGKPVSDASVSVYGDGQPNQHMQAAKDGTFRFDKICKGEVRVNVHRQRGGGYGDIVAQAGATDVHVVIGERAPYEPPPPKLPESLVGKPLPSLGTVGLDVPAEQLREKPVLLCFWNRDQRPSRWCLKQLTGVADALRQRGVVLATVHAGAVDEAVLSAFVGGLEPALPTAVLGETVEQTRDAWGVRGLPWLILTDREHVVRADGFGFGQLEEKLAGTQ